MKSKKSLTLCNNGLVGIEAHQTPLVAFRTHDCIACLLGSNEAYQKEFTQTPGTYWLSIGWVENANDYSQYMGAVPEIPPPDDPAWLELVEKYGEDNAQFLWEERRKQLVNYERMAYIDTDVGPQEVMADEAKRRAVASHLRFERLTGDRRWIDALFADNWDPAKFVIVPPHHRIIARVNETIMDCVAIPQS